MRLTFLVLTASMLLSGQNTASVNSTQTRAANGQAVSGPPQPTSFDCSADGTVVNGLSGEPIARARVSINIAANNNYGTSTDSSGKWALMNLACAPGQITASRAGFVQPIPAAGRNNAVNRPLQLVSGSPVHGVRIELVPQAVAAGKVLDADGDPVQGVTVSALQERVVDGQARFQQNNQTTTNDLGEYRLFGLQRGRYIFCAQFNNRPQRTNERSIPAESCYPGPVEGGPASAMDLPPGHEARADFTMSEVPAFRISGTVSGGPEGRGVGVNLVKAQGTVDGQRNLPPRNMRNGQFEFRVPSGSYVLTADYFEAGKRLSARVPVSVGNTDIEGITVQMEPGFAITGVVRVVSDSGRTAPQFGMSLRSTEPGAGSGQLKWNDDHTTFTFHDTIPGTYRLQATPPPPFYAASATLAGQDILNKELPISQAAGPIEITLKDDGGVVEGDIVDTSGQPVAGGVMILRGTTRVSSAPAGVTGHFKVANLPPGDYTAYAWDDLNRVQFGEPDWMRRNATGGVPVTITAGQTTTVKLTEAAVPPE